MRVLQACEVVAPAYIVAFRTYKDSGLQYWDLCCCFFKATKPRFLERKGVRGVVGHFQLASRFVLVLLLEGFCPIIPLW